MTESWRKRNRERYNKTRNEKYHSDPEFREKTKQKALARYRNKKLKEFVDSVVDLEDKE